ncbi:hypothetical protein JHK85_032623 [Glycine max]|nr:hypothetical protein JHK85_032623 [Glycine max]
MGFYGSCGSSSNKNAKLQAIYHGISVTWLKGVQHLTCESDSKVTFQLITDGVISSHIFYLFIQKIRSFLHLHWKLMFRHSHCEGNTCANWLAKKGASKNDHLLSLDTCPPKLKPMLMAFELALMEKKGFEKAMFPDLSSCQRGSSSSAIRLGGRMTLMHSMVSEGRNFFR